MGLKFQKRGSGGRTLICLHGFLGEGSDWDKFASAFLPHSPEWKLVQVDLPGHCDEQIGWVCPSVDEFSAALRGLVMTEGWSPSVLAGYSLGGRLGLHAALSFPTTFPVFIGISTTAGIQDEAERADRLLSDEALASRLRSLRDFSNFLREWWHQPVFASPAREAGDLEMFVTSRQHRDPARMAACLEAWSPGRLPSQWSALPDYPGRALLLSGEADVKYISAAARMQAAFQKADHLSISGAGHQLLSEKPHEVARFVADFLNQIP